MTVGKACTRIVVTAHPEETVQAVAQRMAQYDVGVSEHTALEEAIALMRGYHVRRLIVVNEHKDLVGVLSCDDTLQARGCLPHNGLLAGPILPERSPYYWPQRRRVCAAEAESMQLTTVRQMTALVLGSLVGLGVGMASYTFLYAQGWSYLTNNPAACANCHIMQDHYNAWIKSSHRAVATCNDCHTPAPLVAKYYTKADHGFWHSYAFTTGDFHEPIRMKARSQAVTENACRTCHQTIVEAIATPHSSSEPFSCIRCHHTVGHP